MRGLVRLLVLAYVALIFTGCANQKAWVYNPDEARTNAQRLDGSAVVMPFYDKRPNTNKNRLAFYAIPLIPGFGWCNFEVPESQQMHMNSGLWTNYNPKEDYAKALAQELENAGVFKESYFSFKKDNAAYVITGSVINTRYKATVISYGLSVYGPLLWFFGLPAGTLSNELQVTLSCEDTASKKVILSKTYTAQPYKRTSWIYTLPNDFAYSEMLKGVYREFIKDLEAQLKPAAAKP